jgi:hypothetical protein
MSRLKPRNLSMLRGFYQTQHPSSKTTEAKEENDHAAEEAYYKLGNYRILSSGAHHG